MIGMVAGVVLAVTATIASEYWPAAIGAVCFFRLLIYFVRGRRSSKLPPNESWITRLRAQRQAGKKHT
jgi:hypothetical protein